MARSEAKVKLPKELYRSELDRLQTELAYLQRWVRKSNARIVVVFEGRDAAGKGGAIKRITSRVSPRTFRVVALPAPTEREATQLYMQRYVRHLPAGGEVTLFDRSWYNRAGVERVMGFATPRQVERFLQNVPFIERLLVDEGFHLIKFFFDVSRDEQERRFLKRYSDPKRQWKLSPMDLESWSRWWDYTEAYAEMFERTDTEWAPWYVVEADDKRRARLNCMAHLLELIPYEKIPYDAPELPEPAEPEGEPAQPVYRNVVPDRYADPGELSGSRPDVVRQPPAALPETPDE